MTCDHKEFRADVNVIRLKDRGKFRGHLAVDVTAHCMECEQPVLFTGLSWGVARHHPTTSADRREARLSAEIALPEHLRTGESDDE